MRAGRLGIGVVATAAVAVALGITVTASASADTPSTLYVGTTGCSDSGRGTSAQPFCTIMAAVAAVGPGQTIDIASGVHNEAVDITKSGTDGAPITITSGLGSIGGAAAGLTIDDAHDIVVTSIFLNQPAASVIVRNSSHITTNRLTVRGSATPAIQLIGTTDSTLTGTSVVDPHGGISLDAATSGVTLTGSNVGAGTTPTPSMIGIDVAGHNNQIIDGGSTAAYTPIQIEPAAANNVVANNFISASIGEGIDDNGSGTDIVNNSIWGVCDVAINVGTASVNASVENNVVEDNHDCRTDGAAEHVGIGVFGAATTSATVDYNTIDSTVSYDPYAWGTDKASLAAFQSASDQGAHDTTGPLNTQNGGYEMPTYRSPMTDSANSAAPGFPATDARGYPRVDDPVTANTGAGPHAYADRGAFELPQTPLLAATSYATQTLLTGDPHPTWSVTETVVENANWAPITSFTANFGDGTASVTKNATLDSTGVDSATFTHTYLSAGAYKISTSDVDSSGATGAGSVMTYLTAPEVTLTADQFAVGSPVTATVSEPAAWTGPATYTFNFGDGTGWLTPDPSSSATMQHVYAKPGSYQVEAAVSGGGITFTSASAEAVIPNPPGRYTTAGPTRILDTRNAIGVTTRTPLAAGHTLSLPISGIDGIPDSGVVAVAINLTAANGTTSGYLTAYADGTPRPTASVVNWSAGSTVPNFVVVPVVNGKIDLYNGGAGSVDVVADLAGYYSAVGKDFTVYGPARALDTRTGLGVGHAAAVAPGQTVRLALSSAFKYAGNPAFTAATFNVTVTQPTKSGYLTVYPDGTVRPIASNLNWAAGETIANMVTVSNSNGFVDFYNGSAGTIELIADAIGTYWSDITDASYAPITPSRVLDTRYRVGVTTTTPIGAHKTIRFTVSRTADMSQYPNELFLFNVTVTASTAGGYLQVASDVGTSNTSNLNWSAGQTIANSAIVNVGPDGVVTVTNGSSGTVQVIIDELGHFTQDVAH